MHDKAPQSQASVNSDAIAYFTRLIELVPNHPEYYYERASLFKQDNNLSEAIADFTRLIDLAPNNPEYYYERASLFKQDNNLSEAIADLKQAIYLDPSIAKYHFKLGDWNFDLNEAVLNLYQAFKLESTNVNVLNRLNELACRQFLQFDRELADKRHSYEEKVGEFCGGIVPWVLGANYLIILNQFWERIHEIECGQSILLLRKERTQALAFYILSYARLDELGEKTHFNSSELKTLLKRYSNKQEVFAAIKKLPYRLAVNVLQQCLQKDTVFNQVLGKGLTMLELYERVDACFLELKKNRAITLSEGIRFLGLGARSEESLLSTLPSEMALEIAKHFSKADPKYITQQFNIFYNP